jgi:hypothetical protein
MAAYAIAVEEFSAAREQFEKLATRLAGAEAMAMTHSELESLVEKDGREVLRQLLQDHLHLRAEVDARKQVPKVEGADGVGRTQHRVHERPLLTVFGSVGIARTAYVAPGSTSLHPLDGQLNLPEELYSHHIRKRLAEEVARGSYDEAIAALERNTGVMVPKRQAEQLALRAAQDFDAFYAGRHAASPTQEANTGGLVCLTSDGKGVPMRKEHLREETRKAAEAEAHKMKKRLSKGEKNHRKRMATVAAVFTQIPQVRKPEDILAELKVPEGAPKPQRPKPENKRVWASVEKEVSVVLDGAYAEAIRRDPLRQKKWVGLVDGNKTQLRLLKKFAKQYGVELTIVLDLIHVLEYLWKAAWAFHHEGDEAAEAWVDERLLGILRGKSGQVAGGIRRSATLRGLKGAARKAADKCADYLITYRQYLRYDEYLAAGLPIATGVVEGACRYVVKDRCEVTGAHWSVTGAEAVLRLRSLRASGDFEAYWNFHLRKEHARNHVVRYAKNSAALAAIAKPAPSTAANSRSHLRVLK